MKKNDGKRKEKYAMVVKVEIEISVLKERRSPKS